MFPKFLLLFTSLIIISAYPAYSQGCSDAGVCTLNSFMLHEKNLETEMMNQISAGASFGIADNSVSVLSGKLGYSRKFGRDFSINAKLTFISQFGNDITTYGISDLFLDGNYNIFEGFGITLGAKIPLHKSDNTKSGRPLPMEYQSSLGTFDIIAGFNFSIDPLQFAIAFQQPLSENDNTFISDVYPVSSALSEFQSTNKFKRSGDLMLRVSYPFELSENFSLALSILPVYHIANDKFTDIDGVEKEIDGSQGLTLNTNIILDYKLNKSSMLQLNLAAPVLVRDSRPDGLTRSFLAALEYRIGF